MSDLRRHGGRWHRFWAEAQSAPPPELSTPTSTVTRTLLNIDAVERSHHDGNTEQACRRTVADLAALPADYCTGLVRRRALDLYKAIPRTSPRARRTGAAGRPRNVTFRPAPAACPHQQDLAK
ncbi:hypothetical protein [Streptomyces sp. NPDC004230]